MAPTATAASSTAAALSVLAACNLKELHLKRADGSRILDSLHATCRSAGLIPPGTPDGTPKERYLAVFDAALYGGLGCWILDYVEVVCADRYLTSNDPLEAYLLDGGFIKAWAQACLHRAEQAATAALTADSAFHTFQAGQLQLQLAQMRILVSVLRALDRIRAVAAGGTVAAAAAAAAAVTTATAGSVAVHDRLSVRAELEQAVLLEQAFQVMDWCARQGLAEPRAATGRFASYAEWSRAVNGRRSRAAPRPLFLDSLLQSLSLSGAYPSSSVQHMLHTLLLVVRDVEPSTWAAKLALLSYYLMDAGVLDGPVAGLGTAAAAAGTSDSPAGGGLRLEGALEDLRRTFRLAPGDVGLWQCHYLLDCAVPDSPGADPHLARACALLPSCVTPSTPFAFIEALLALGRPDVALAVDRGQSGADSAAAAVGGGTASSGQMCRTLPQAMTLLDIRLRCGLMTEAFMLLRQHSAYLAAHGEGPERVEEHTRALLRQLATWAAAADGDAPAEDAAAAAGGAAAPMDTSAVVAAEGGWPRGGGGGGGGGWLNRLTELPLNATEELVLVGWLAEEAEAGRPAGGFLSLFFLQRGRVNEGLAAWRRWDARQAALAAAGRPRSPLLTDLVAACIDAAHGGLLPGPLRNLLVPAPGGDPAAPLPSLLPELAPRQGAVGILAGLLDQQSPDQTLAVLPFHGPEPPPLVTRVVQLPPPYLASSGAPAPAASGEAEGRAFDAEAGLMTLTMGSYQSFPQQQQQQQQSFMAMPLLLPSSAPFRAAPGTPGHDASGLFRPTAGSGGSGTLGVAGGGGGGGALLFSVGGGVLAAGGPGGGPGGAAASARSYKRSKPNDWLL